MAAHIGRETYHLAWDAAIPPILRVASGEVVSFDVLDASCGQLTADSTVEAIPALDFARVDQVGGPVHVEGAEPGDTLEVELLAFQPADWGWTASIPGFGLLADEFPDPALRITRLADGVGEFLPGVRIPLAPFCGVLGLASPGEPRSTIPPTTSGGNMDTRHLVAGTRLWLPVTVPGALFSLGDGHAAQGDGEVCGTAIETPHAGPACASRSARTCASRPPSSRRPAPWAAPRTRAPGSRPTGWTRTSSWRPGMPRGA